MPHDDAEDVRAAIAGELRLLEPSVRGSPAEVAALLHPDFFEFGASGRRWDRREIIAALAAEQTSPQQAALAAVSELTGVRLADGVVLVTYVSEDETRRCNRSSLWRKAPTGWRVCFHQGTVIPASQ